MQTHFVCHFVGISHCHTLVLVPKSVNMFLLTRLCVSHLLSVTPSLVDRALVHRLREKHLRAPASIMVAERQHDATATVTQRKRSKEEQVNVETTAARRRRSEKEHVHETKNSCADEVLVNNRWATVTGDDAEYIQKLVVIFAQDGSDG